MQQPIDQPTATESPDPTPDPFIASHHYRIDYPDGTHVRFSGLRCAARTSVETHLPVWDEKNGKGYNWIDCLRIKEGA